MQSAAFESERHYLFQGRGVAVHTAVSVAPGSGKQRCRGGYVLAEALRLCLPLHMHPHAPVSIEQQGWDSSRALCLCRTQQGTGSRTSVCKYC